MKYLRKLISQERGSKSREKLIKNVQREICTGPSFVNYSSPSSVQVILRFFGLKVVLAYGGWLHRYLSFTNWNEVAEWRDHRIHEFCEKSGERLQNMTEYHSWKSKRWHQAISYSTGYSEEPKPRTRVSSVFSHQLSRKSH